MELEPADVAISGSSSSGSPRRRTGMARSSRAEDARSAMIRLVHRPTGLEIEGEIPSGPYSRNEMGKRTDDLIAELWAKLVDVSSRTGPTVLMSIGPTGRRVRACR